MRFPKLSHYKSVDQLRARLVELEIDIPCDVQVHDAEKGSPLAKPLQVAGRTIGNRFCIQPMEGWDGTTDGYPTELTKRRWKRFGQSGAKLIWGGEATAVVSDGRANPRQLMGLKQHQSSLDELLNILRDEHRRAFERDDDLLVGLQLTHSGRFSRPNSKKLEPRIAYHHPLLDQKFGIDPRDDSVVWTDAEIERLIEQYVATAKIARAAGFDFVDIKACHGYLLHEFLSARSRAGIYGGDFEGRTRVLKTIIEEVLRACPELMVGVRLSVFDFPPFLQGEHVGESMDWKSLGQYRWAFGANADNPLEMDLEEPIRLLKGLQEMGVFCVNLTCGSPYYNPHIQRPAIFPPSDGYLPPEDPLVGVARQMRAVRRCREAVPGLPLVGTGYSYLQEFLPNVAQAAVRDQWVDFVGLGRMVLSYPTLPSDVLKGERIDRKHICRTFSDCTTAPRNGIESGCYPLDEFYKGIPQYELVQELRKNLN